MSELAQKPADVQGQAPPADNYDPLSGPVNNKNYSIPPGNIPQDPNIPIPEPIFTPPGPDSKKFDDPFDDMLKKERQEDQKKKQQEHKQAPPPYNPALEGTGPDERTESAEHMTQAIMGGYEMMHHYANEGLKVSERRIYKMVNKGELNMNASVPYEYDKRMPIGEFIRSYNEQADGTFTVSQKFRDKVEPLLTKVLAKRGHGFSDEQLLLILFGKDIIMKGQMFFAMRSTLNQILSLAKEESASMHKPAPPQPPPPPAPAKVVPMQPAAPPQPDVYVPKPGSALAVQAQHLGANMPTNITNTPPPARAQFDDDFIDDAEEAIAAARSTGRGRGKSLQEVSDGLDDALMQAGGKKKKERKPRSRKPKPE